MTSTDFNDPDVGSVVITGVCQKLMDKQELLKAGVARARAFCKKNALTVPDLRPSKSQVTKTGKPSSTDCWKLRKELEMQPVRKSVVQ